MKIYVNGRKYDKTLDSVEAQKQEYIRVITELYMKNFDKSFEEIQFNYLLKDDNDFLSYKGLTPEKVENDFEKYKRFLKAIQELKDYVAKTELRALGPIKSEYTL